VNYASVSDVRAILYGIDTSPLTKAGANLDSLISTFLPVTKRIMDNAMKQRLDQTIVTGARFNGKGTPEILLPYYPIKTVTKCAIYYGLGNSLYEFQHIWHRGSELLGLPADATAQNADLIVERDTGIISINPSSLTLVSQQGAVSPLWDWVFSEGRQNVLVSLIHGFETIPDDIKIAHAMKTAAMLGNMAAGRGSGGATSTHIGSVSKSWAKPYEALFKSWDEMANQVAACYEVREAY
jgi:hypothetical protein